MTEHRYAQRAARLLRAARGRIGPHPSAPSGDTVELLAGVIRSTAARRRRRRIARSIGAAAGALCVALVVGWTLTPAKRPASTGALTNTGAVARPTFVAQGTAVATVGAAGGSVQPLLPGQEWRTGEHLRTDARAVALATRDETAIEVEPHSDLQLVRADAERWLRLGSGAVDVHVAKLKAAERFVIATPDAEVEVRGTRFRVAVVPAVNDCGRGTVTRVSVTEGVVVVRSFGRQSRVEAGGRWPGDCAERSGSVSLAAPVSVSLSGSTSKAPPPAGALRDAPKRQASPRAPAFQDSVPVDVPVSTLATENDLFSAALRAEGAGDRREAVQLLDVLLTRFPVSPLKESAAVERARLIGSLQPRP